jgi:hypothetical protein
LREHNGCGQAVWTRADHARIRRIRHIHR